MCLRTITIAITLAKCTAKIYGIHKIHLGFVLYFRPMATTFRCVSTSRKNVSNTN